VIALAVEADTALPHGVKLVDEKRNVRRSNVWTESRWGMDRLFEARRLFGDNRVRVIADQLPPGVTVGMFLSESDWCYPFRLANPGVHFVSLGRPDDAIRERTGSLRLNYLLCLGPHLPARPEGSRGRRLWASDPQAPIQGYLLELPNGNTSPIKQTAVSPANG
jgi:hypothetical protein